MQHEPQADRTEVEPLRPAATPSPPRVPRAHKRWFVVAILAAIAGLQELLFRAAFPMPEVENFNRIDYTPTMMFSSAIAKQPLRGLSNVRIVWESEPDGMAFEHRLNIYGFRGPDFAIDPPGDRPRVLFIGDSFVEGCGAADGDTIPVQFAAALNRSRAVEAVNLGVAAANFPEYAQLFRDAVPLLKPAAVFLIVCANDLPAPPLALRPSAPQRMFPRLSPFVPRAGQVVYRLATGQVVPRRFTAGPFSFFAPVPSENNPLSNKPDPPGVDPAILDAMKRGKTNPWHVNLASFCERILRHDFTSDVGAGEHLRFAAEVCHRHDGRLIVVYIPHLGAANPIYLATENKLGTPGFEGRARLDQPPYRNQQEHLAKVCHELGIPFLDTTEEFIEAEKGPQRLFWAVDTHCTAAGYRLVAELCAKYWSDGGMPRPPAYRQ